MSTFDYSANNTMYITPRTNPNRSSQVDGGVTNTTTTNISIVNGTDGKPREYKFNKMDTRVLDLGNDSLIQDSTKIHDVTDEAGRGGVGYSHKKTHGDIMESQSVSQSFPNKKSENKCWTCSKCGNINYGHRSICNLRKCGAPRPADREETMENLPQLIESSNQHRRNLLFKERVTNGAASNTGNSNKYGLSSTNIRYGSQMWGFEEPSNYDTPGYKGGNKSEKNATKSSTPNGQIAGWICGRCTNFNFENRKTCNMRICGMARPEHTPILFYTQEQIDNMKPKQSTQYAYANCGVNYVLKTDNIADGLINDSIGISHVPINHYTKPAYSNLRDLQNSSEILPVGMSDGVEAVAMNNAISPLGFTSNNVSISNVDNMMTQYVYNNNNSITPTPSNNQSFNYGNTFNNLLLRNSLTNIVGPNKIDETIPSNMPITNGTMLLPLGQTEVSPTSSAGGSIGFGKKGDMSVAQNVLNSLEKKESNALLSSLEHILQSDAPAPSPANANSLAKSSSSFSSSSAAFFAGQRTDFMPTNSHARSSITGTLSQNMSSNSLSQLMGNLFSTPAPSPANADYASALINTNNLFGISHGTMTHVYPNQTS